MGDCVALCLDLIEGVVYALDVFDMHRKRGKRGVQKHEVAYLEALRVVVLSADFLYRSANEPARVRNRVVELAAADCDIDDLLLHLLVVIVRFCAYLLETRALELDPLDGDSQLIRAYFAAVVQLPRRGRQNELGFKHAFYSISRCHYRFILFSANTNRFEFILFSIINHWHAFCNIFLREF